MTNETEANSVDRAMGAGQNEGRGSDDTGDDAAESLHIAEADMPTRLETLLLKGLGIALAVVLLLLLALHTLIGGWPVHYGAPVRGRVIDGHTGKPVAGAVVVGEWYATQALGGERRMHASEAITDSQGSFLLPGMPLKIRRPLDHYETYDPIMAIYKPGYAAVFGADNFALKRMGPRPYSMGMKRVSYWDGKELSLVPVDDIKSEAEALQRIYSIANGREEMHPRRYPNVWSAIVQGANRIPKGQFGSYGDPRESYDYHMRNEE